MWANWRHGCSVRKPFSNISVSLILYLRNVELRFYHGSGSLLEPLASRVHGLKGVQRHHTPDPPRHSNQSPSQIHQQSASFFLLLDATRLRSAANRS